jgi:NADPH:quinone reductase-like Zn-dependent oxidoreductase
VRYNLTHEQASVIPIVGVTASSIFTKLLTIEKGMEVLVNGATGGIGMFATQMAKSRGAIVTTVVSSKGMDLAKKWGADHIVNYKETDILQSYKKYDVVIELSDKLPFSAGKTLLKEKGFYVASLPNPKEILSGLINNLYSKRKYKLVGSFANQANLEMLANEAKNGKLEIVIGKEYLLKDFKEAYSKTAKGEFIGKVVFSI